jgi:hypothetical protein
VRTLTAVRVWLVIFIVYRLIRRLERELAAKGASQIPVIAQKGAA